MVSSQKISLETILGYALRCLGRTRLTEKQLREKIVRRFTRVNHKNNSDHLNSSNIEMSDMVDGEVFQEDIDQVIARMKEEKYLDDRELATIFIRDTMARRPHGRLWIQQQLIKKGVDRAIIAEALESHRQERMSSVAGDEVDGELAAARIAAEKKLRLLSGKNLEPRKQYEKMFRFLVGRGFDTSMVIRVLDEMAS